MEQGKPEPKKTDKPIKKAFWGPLAVIFFTVALYFVSQIIASFMLLGIFQLVGTSYDFESWIISGPLPQFVYVLFTDVLVMLAVYGLLRIKKSGFRSIGLRKPTWNDAQWAVVSFIVYIVALVTFTGLAKVLVPSLDIEQDQQLGFESTKNLVELITIGISLVILPPIVEEILMRGFLYKGLKTKMTLWPAALTTSLIFAVAHLQLGSGAPPLWIGAIDTFILSMFLVYLREKTNGLPAPIMLHMLKNGLAFTLLFIFAVG